MKNFLNNLGIIQEKKHDNLQILQHNYNLAMILLKVSLGLIAPNVVLVSGK